MMSIPNILKTAEKFVLDKSPGILTGIGVAGTVTSVLLTGRAAFQVGMDASTQYHEAVKEDEDLPEHLLETKHIVKTYWKAFIPGAAVGAATVAAIIAANQIGSRRTAAITAAFKLSEQISQEYKDKVVKTLGLQKEEKLRSELAAEKINANPPSAGMIIVAGSDVLFLDEMSGRYFHSQIEKVKAAVNEINHKVNNYFHASLTDFYELIGLEGTKFSSSVGWNTDRLLEVNYTATMYEDKPAIMLQYSHSPIVGYDRLA
jgi:Family of unknown function (DUF6353)